MKINLVLLLLVLMLAACSSPPEFTDTGQPGTIDVIVFLDANGNRIIDSGEEGISAKVAISQEVSCPAANMDNVTQAATDDNGEYTFENLTPGRYCVAILENFTMSTKLTYEIFLSSEQTIQVAFGITQ